VADKILVIDDDPNVAELVKLILKPRGLDIYHAINGQEGLKKAYELQPSLIILDIMMPEQDGYEVCARLREFSDVPIVMLTAKSLSSDVTRGFAVGADDYVKKPFSNDELVSRIESLLRRKKSNDASENITGYSDGLLEVEFSTQKVTLQGEEIALTPTEFKLLAFLIRHPQKTLSTRTLLAEVWGDAYSRDKALLSLYIHQLRQKLKDGETDHSYLKTHWGQGYWFNSMPQPQTPSPVQTADEQEDNEQENEEQIKEEQIKEEQKTSLPFIRNKWLWLGLGGLVVLLAGVLFLQNASRAFTPISNDSQTTIEAYMTAEGFIETDSAGVRGQICVENAGTSPTENLSIINTVQVYSESTVRYISSTVDLSKNPVLDPGNTYCYPFELSFGTDFERDAQYRITTTITIINHTGLETGSKNCPGSRPCPYGPEVSTDLILPEP
jgi:two-component system KDP operon response regulator KdpE